MSACHYTGVSQNLIGRWRAGNPEGILLNVAFMLGRPERYVEELLLPNDQSVPLA